MANRVASVFERGLKVLEVAHGSPIFRFQGQDIPCITNTLKKGEQVVAGGALSEIDMTIIVRKSQVPESIALTMDSVLWFMDDTDITMDQTVTRELNPGRKLIKSGRPYRILKIRYPAGDGHIELDVGSAKR